MMEQGQDVAARAEAPVKELTSGDATEISPEAVPVTMFVDGEHWYGDGWSRRAAVSISHAGDGQLANYPVRIALSFQEGMKADFSDVRFAADNGVTELAYVLESVLEGREAVARVVVPSLDRQVFVYYGNPDAKTASDASLLKAFTPAASEPQANMGEPSAREMNFMIIPPPPIGSPGNPGPDASVKAPEEPPSMSGSDEAPAPMAEPKS
jgi:hypothetical protein